LQLFLVRPRNLAGPWKAGNLEALVYFKFNRYQAVLRFFEVPIIPFEADILWIPDGESFLIIKGCNGRFTVTNEVAAALRNFPAGKNGYIRFSTEGTGSAVLSEIGNETVQAWKKVYANWVPEAPPKVESLGF